MPKLCCFTCPSEDYSEKELEDICPKCKRAFGYPLFFPPKSVRSYEIVKPLARGFYSATFIVKSGPFDKNNVMKVIPKIIYDYFNKDFDAECDTHYKAAQNTDHIAQIENKFEAKLAFGDISLDCHIAILEHIKGCPLSEFLRKDLSNNPYVIGQLAIDLFKVIGELENRTKRHNDLHQGNIIIEELSEENRRSEVLYDRIKVKIIDLGSAADASKSDGNNRLGDRHWIAFHLSNLVDKLLMNPDNTPDINYRLAMVLEQHIQLLSPDPTSDRGSSTEEIIENIKSGINVISSPWKETLKLRRFNDAYNAQSLDPWFVPSLIVDRDDQWLQKISIQGPQMITGMRGCGKTMLLRALQFHARAAKRKLENNPDIIKRIEEDSFVGLFVSCKQLLNRPGIESNGLFLPFERLFLFYAIESIKAVRHLKELDKSSIPPLYYIDLARIVKECLGGPDDILQVSSEYDLERKLTELTIRMGRLDNEANYKINPIEAFTHLAKTISGFSKYWHTKQILFLLDDMSTRFLSIDTIATMSSTFIFQVPECAFKITTEAQTFEEVLRSPGLIDSARIGRDYDVFDLGEEVYQKTRIQKTKREKHFVESILENRIAYYPKHPKANPVEILGNTSLISIANKIASTSENSAKRKEIYYGITALSKVCVGDIGDVISIYELILREAVGNSYPIDASIQNKAFLDFGSRRIYDLNRRKNELKDFAISFSEATHDLLMKSFKGIREGKTKRLRQYSGIYIRITSGDTFQQFQKLRGLIDAGVFVFQGGSPRTKTRDSDPVLQIKLTFRKLYGLNKFIGLAERDRFELSGEQLEEWLNNPKKGKDILLRNLGGAEKFIYDDDEVESTDELIPIEQTELELSKSGEIIKDIFSNGYTTTNHVSVFDNLIFTEIQANELKTKKFDYLIIGLGFEERTFGSVERILDILTPCNVLLINYKEPGYSKQIVSLCDEKQIPYKFVNYEDILKEGFSAPKGNILIDITGLAKPVIYSGIRSILNTNSSIHICHTTAEMFYPSDEAISIIIDNKDNNDQYEIIKSIDQILTGETGPYTMRNLLVSDVDETRRNLLCAFASPKHERLLNLIEMRGYDRIEIITQPKVTPRGKLAYMVAKIAGQNYQGSDITLIDSDNLEEVIKLLYERYNYWYSNRGFNYEYGLTGSKMQAVACAAISTIQKIANVWYVSPAKFDTNKYSKGIGKSNYYEIYLRKNL